MHALLCIYANWPYATVRTRLKNDLNNPATTHSTFGTDFGNDHPVRPIHDGETPSIKKFSTCDVLTAELQVLLHWLGYVEIQDVVFVILAYP